MLPMATFLLSRFRPISITVLFCWLIHFSVFSQDKLAFGVSGAYNLAVKNIGIRARVQVPIVPRLYVVPSFCYMPKFNEIHEYTVSLPIHYVIYEGNEKYHGHKARYEPFLPNIYLIAGVSYNKWINYVETLNSNAKQENLLPEAGVGISIGDYPLQFFAEGKYNPTWKEGLVELGVLICPAYLKKDRKSRCPKF